MSDNVESLRPGIIHSANKRLFLDTVAASFDLYVEERGQEPEAIAYVLGGCVQTVVSGRATTGVTARGCDSFLSISALCLQQDVTNISTE